MKWPTNSVAGATIIVLYCVFTFSSWALFSTTYSPIINWLSDLGNSSYDPRGAILYNLGCIWTGIALFPFFIGFYKWHTKETWRKISMMITQAVGCVAAFALIMIGVFSEDSGWLHSLWSEVFFLLNMIALVLAGASPYIYPYYAKGWASTGSL